MMTGDILSVEFHGPDCEDGQMVLRVRVKSGGVIGGKCVIDYPSRKIPYSVYEGICDSLVGDGAGLGLDAVSAVAKEMWTRQMLIST